MNEVKIVSIETHNFIIALYENKGYYNIKVGNDESEKINGLKIALELFDIKVNELFNDTNKH